VCAANREQVAVRSQFQPEAQPPAHAIRDCSIAWLAPIPIQTPYLRHGASVNRSGKEIAGQAWLQLFWEVSWQPERAPDTHCFALNDMAFSAGVPGWETLRLSAGNQNDGKIHPWPAFPTTFCGANTIFLARRWPNITACLSGKNKSGYCCLV
jgi:hypothetical protein